jgi:hypothetical protein
VRKFQFPILHRVLTIAALIALAAVPASGAPNYKLKLLHAFCKLKDCTDGLTPDGGLLQDSTGALYGATSTGGKYDEGLVFKLIQNGTTWTEYVLHNFCKSSCTDGANPVGDLIMDKDGNLYGVTFFGYGGHGANGGTFFKLTNEGNGWKFSLLLNFNTHVSFGLAYAGQSKGAPWDGHSPLFGTTLLGGHYQNGTVFELTTDGSKWTYTTIHTFQSASGPNPVLVDSAGNIWGTACCNAKFLAGELYKLAPGTWKQTIVKNFCSAVACSDGSYPVGRLLMDASGNLFGVTYGGGTTGCAQNQGCGVAFERSAGGTYSVIYTFCSLANCADGSNPYYAGLTEDKSGHLFGTTLNGGSGANCSKKGGCGTAFELSNNGGGSWSESVLHSFCNFANCGDGALPQAPVNVIATGEVFGTTTDLGAHGNGGTVFELVP